MQYNEGLELANINQIDSNLFNNRILSLDSNIIDIFGLCYCCQERTDLRSPCICRTHICDSCLITYVKYNDKCTICNSELDIYIPTPTSTLGRNTSFSFSGKPPRVLVIRTTRISFHSHRAILVIPCCGR